MEPVVDLTPGHVFRLTPDELALVDKAMRAAEGKRADAAKLLGVAYVQLSQAISRHPVLRSTWIVKDDDYVEPVESDNPRLAHRSPPGEVTVRTDDEIRARQLTRVENKVVAVGPDKQLSKSLGKLGFRTEEVDKLVTVEEFAGQHFVKTLSIMHGGVIKGAMRVMLLLERIERDYLSQDDLSDADRNFYWDVYFRLLESLRALGSQADKAAITRALVNQKGRNPGLGKPGFSAIQINVGQQKHGPSD